MPLVTPAQMPLPAQGGSPARPGAVLLLFGDGAAGPDLLFIERSATLRSHAGQPAFPGGAQDPGDLDAIAAALREAGEEVGLRADCVEVFGTLPPVLVPPSDFVVTPVLAYWRQSHDVGPVDFGEVAAVERVAISSLVDPANRCGVRLNAGRHGPGFQVHGLLVWGFTAVLTDRVLEWGGWAQPWSPEPLLDRPAAPPPVTR